MKPAQEHDSTILIVDDTLPNLRLLGTVLSEAGYRIRAVAEPERVVGVARSCRPHLVLLDVKMPGRSGYEVCEELKADPELAEVPVIFISALNETLDKVRAFSVGGVDYVTKPFQADEVLARVHTHLSLFRMRRQLQEANDELEARVEARTADLAETNASLQEALERAEEMSRLKTRFLENMSHEIRTPLTGIMGFSALLEDEGNESQREFARLITQGAERLLDTLNLIIDLSAIEAGTLEFYPEPIDLNEALVEWTEPYVALAAQKGVAFGLDLPDEAPRVFADQRSLERMIRCLVHNAVKFTPDGGIGVRAWVEDDGWVLEVEDTGVGIGEDFLPFMFDAFAQESMGLRRSYEGNGLGLTVFKGLLDAMDGVVDVASEKGSGTHIVVRLPMRQRMPVALPHSIPE